MATGQQQLYFITPSNPCYYHLYEDEDSPPHLPRRLRGNSLAFGSEGSGIESQLCTLIPVKPIQALKAKRMIVE